MKEFRFNCPGCGQHILASKDWIGREVNCPSCKRGITIPPPLKEQKGIEASEQRNNLVGTPAVPEPGSSTLPPPSPSAEKGPVPAEPPSQEPPSRTGVQAVDSAPPSKGPSTSAEEPERLRVAVLTPEVKLNMVRAVRQRIGNESCWLPGLKEGKEVFATKEENGKTVLVGARDPGATRFSLIGAFLREFQERNVARTAVGRTKLLDREIVEAIRDVLLDEMDDEQRERTPDPLVAKSPLSISHAQCLAALDVLEERYSQKMEQSRAEKVKRRLGNVRLSDLITKLEKKERIAPEEVATALYHELTAVRRRLDQLEHARSEQKPTK